MPATESQVRAWAGAVGIVAAPNTVAAITAKPSRRNHLFCFMRDI
jgi:hypothetical protein